MTFTCLDFLKTRVLRPGRVWMTLAALSLAASSAHAQTVVNLTDQGSAAANGTALQTAINNAALNTRIILPAGLTYQNATGILLKYKAPGTGYITIESANLSTMPAGERVTSGDLSNMPKILSPGSNYSAIKTEASATGVHHYKLLGLNIEKGGPPTTDLGDIVAIGTGSSSQNTTVEVPNNIIIDRCYIKGAANTLRGVVLHGQNLEVRNCTITDIIHNGSQSAGIGGWNGIGGYIIDNNYIAATGENIIFGGAAISIPNMVPTGFTITRNHIEKPVAWRHTSDGGTNANGYRVICNLFEIKCGQDFVVEGNVFENCWGSPTNHRGTAMAWKVSNWDESNWVVSRNVTFRKNIIRNCSIGIVAQGRDYSPAPGSPYGLVSDYNINNNLFYNISNSFLPSNTGQIMYQTEGGLANMTLDHNTAFGTSFFISIETSGYDTTGATIKNNMTQSDVRSSGGLGNIPLNDWYPGVVWQKNVLKGVNSNNYTSYNGGFTPLVAFPSSYSGVLVNQASPGANFAGYKVVNGSAYDNSGTDGKDIGCDIDALNSATAGCVTGVWSSPPVTITLKNGVNGYTGNQTFMAKGSTPTTFIGGDVYQTVVNNHAGSNGSMSRSFFKFDVSQIPSGATIDSATLRVKVTYSNNPTNPTMSVHRMAPVNNAFTINYLAATRNSYNGTASTWTGGTNAGGDVANSNNDFLDTPDSTANLPAGGAVGTLSFNVASSVQAWVNGTANNGWTILTAPVTTTVYMGASADITGSVDYPELEVTYHQ